MTGANPQIRRILMTADTVGGVWTYALDLSRALAALRIDVALATMGAPLSSSQRRDAAAIPGLQIYESAFRLEWMDDPWLDVSRAGDWLLTLENEVAPDIVHLNGYAHGDLPWHSPHLIVGHSCVLSWWRAVKGEDAPAAWMRYRDAVTRGLRSADCVVAPTRAMLAALQTHYGPLARTAVVPNGRDPLIYRPGRKEPFILAAGRVWDEAKNISVLSSAGSAVNWPVCVAGDHRHPDGGIRELPNVQTLGRLDPPDLASWFGRAAIYCLPARYEPFGLSVLEAALSGCALVLGDVPSLRENWEGAAAFVPPDDAAAVGHALGELIANSSRRDELSTAALTRSSAFTPERMAAGYVDLYALLRGRPSAVLQRG